MNLFKRKQRPVHRGNMLLQAGIALAIVLYLAPGAIDGYANRQQEQLWTGTASHLSFVAQAGKRYVRDNRDTLLTKVVSGPVIVTGAALQSAGYLPAGFSLTNDSGQTYQLAVAKDPVQAGQLVAFVLTTGGSDIPFKGLRQIAAETDGMGGYVWPANTATGADGGWQAKLGDYGLSGQQGRLAAFLSADALGTDSDGSDRLYRYQVNGKPDLNRMHTAIDMNGNNLNNGGAVNAATGSFTGQVSAGANVTAGGNVTATGNITANGSITANNAMTANNDIRSNNGWVITQGSKGWMNETYGGGFYMSDSQWVRSVNNKGLYTGGQVRGGSVRSDADVSGGGVLTLDQVNTAGASCSVTGAISRNSSGAILSCQSGVWIATGGSGFKAPAPQTVSCETSYNSYIKMWAYAQIDSQGIVSTRMVTDSNISTDWVKGATGKPEQAASVIPSIAGVTGYGTQDSCHQTTCTSSVNSCFAAWQY